MNTISTAVVVFNHGTASETEGRAVSLFDKDGKVLGKVSFAGTSWAGGIKNLIETIKAQNPNASVGHVSQLKAGVLAEYREQRNAVAAGLFNAKLAAGTWDRVCETPGQWKFIVKKVATKARAHKGIDKAALAAGLAANGLSKETIDIVMSSIA